MLLQCIQCWGIGGTDEWLAMRHAINRIPDRGLIGLIGFCPQGRSGTEIARKILLANLP